MEIETGISNSGKIRGSWPPKNFNGGSSVIRNMHVLPEGVSGIYSPRALASIKREISENSGDAKKNQNKSEDGQE